MGLPKGNATHPQLTPKSYRLKPLQGLNFSGIPTMMNSSNTDTEFTMKQPKTLPTVNLVFATALSLTLGSGGTALHLASQPTLTEAQTRVFNSAIALWTTGTTTLIGLLTTTKPPHD